MLWQLLKFLPAYLGIMASGPLLLLIANLFWKAQIDRFIDQQPVGAYAVLASYVFFVCVMFFRLQSVFMVFRPEPGTVPLPKEELLGRLEGAFGTPTSDRKLFDFVKSRDRAVITWSSSITYFQGRSAGVAGLKRVVVLNFFERNHVVFFIMKNRDWRWDLSENFTEFSLNYNLELSAEMRTEVHPSIEFGPYGLRVDMKKLSYSSEELWQPIRTAVLSSGWTLRGGMLPHFRQQLFLSSTISLAVFLLLTGVGAGFRKLHSPAPPPVTSSAPAASQWKQPGSQENAALIEKAAAGMATAQLWDTIEAHMKIPAQYMQGEQAKVFSIYAGAYLARKDKDEVRAKVLTRFAEDRKLDVMRK